MANIRVDLDYMLQDGAEIKFRSPVDCSQITGLIVYYPGADGNTVSKVFTLADAHGNNVGNIDHLFAENVVVKVILDVTTSMAFVQNADTNAYLEARINKAAPVNLLDNSDFRNAVNQRRFTSRETSYAGMTNVLDRWLWWNVSGGNAFNVSYTEGVGFTVHAKSGPTRLVQKLNPDSFDSTTYTSCFCMCSDGTLIEGGVDNTTLGGGVYSALFDIPAGKTVIWAVAYKGHYTAETLPEYRPKGYGTELAECMRYFQKSSFLYQAATSTQTAHGRAFSVKMRTIPTITVISANGAVGKVTQWNPSGTTDIEVTAIPVDELGIYYLQVASSVGYACGYSYEANAEL